MHQLLFVLIVLISCHVAAAAKQSDVVFSELVQASERAKGAPLKLTTTSFEKWVKRTPKNYTIALILTTLSGKFACPNCGRQYRDFKLLARSYYSSLPSNGFKSSEFLKKPLFFAVLDYSNENIELFRLFMMQDIPHFAVIKPIMRSSAFHVGQKEQGPIIAAEDMNRMLNNVNSFRISLLRPLWPELVKWLTYFVVGFVVFVLLLPQMFKHRKSAIFPFAFSIGVFCVSMSGLVYNLIRSPPFFSQNPYTGEMVLFDKSGRGQYVLEGIVASVLMTVSALLIILISSLGELEFRSMGATKFRIAFYGLCFLLYLSLSSLFQVFLTKYAWYPYKFATVDFIGWLEAYMKS